LCPSTLWFISFFLDIWYSRSTAVATLSEFNAANNARQIITGSGFDKFAGQNLND
jgi:hypothetical protein